MYKATNNAQHYQIRAGSFSTRGSARGANLLGWDGESESLTPDQERECLLMATRRIQERLKHDSVTQEERRAMGRELAVMSLRLSELREHTKKGREILVDRYTLDVLKEGLPPQVWRAAVHEAYGRMARHNARTGSGMT